MAHAGTSISRAKRTNIKIKKIVARHCSEHSLSKKNNKDMLTRKHKKCNDFLINVFKLMENVVLVVKILLYIFLCLFGFN